MSSVDNNQKRDIESGGLERTLSRFGAFAVIVGSIIGSGVFANGVLVYKNVPFSAIAMGCWIVGGIAVICGGLTWAEWALTVPESVGDVGYLDLSFKRPYRLFSSMYIIARTFFIHPCTIGALGSISAQFIANAIPVMKAIADNAGTSDKDYAAATAEKQSEIIKSVWIMKAFSVGVLFVAFSLVAFSNKIVINSVKFLTIFKQSLLVVLICIGIYFSTQIKSIQDTGLSPAFPAQMGDFKFSNLANAMLTILFCYDGFANLSTFIMELKDPQRNTLPAISFSTISVTILYVAINFFYLIPFSSQELKTLEKSEFAAEYVSRAFSNISGNAKLGIRSTMSILFFTSAFGATISYLYASSRLAMSAGEQGYYPFTKWLSAVNQKFKTPFNGTVFQIVLAMAYLVLIPGGATFEFLCVCSAYMSWILYVITAAALLYTRYTQPNLHRPFKAVIFAPIFVVLCGIFLIIVQLTMENLVDKLQAIVAWVIVLVTIVYYYVYLARKFQKQVKAVQE